MSDLDLIVRPEQSKGHGGFRAMRWRPEPLDEALQRVGGIRAAAKANGIPRKDRDRIASNFESARDRGAVTLQLVDQICVDILNIHPCEIYGEAWWAQ